MGFYDTLNRETQRRKLTGDPYSGLGGGAINNLGRFIPRTLGPEGMFRRERARKATSAYDTALDNPTETLGIFRDFYKDTADAYSAQAGRDFQQNIGTVAGNIARRFGGNASSYEQDQVNQAGDIFSRNLTEVLAGLAPQAASQGLAYTGMLGQRADSAIGQQDDITEQILRALGLQREAEKSKGGGLGGFLGNVLGNVASTAATALI